MNKHFAETLGYSFVSSQILLDLILRSQKLVIQTAISVDLKLQKVVLKEIKYRNSASLNFWTSGLVVTNLKRLKRRSETFNFCAVTRRRIVVFYDIY